MNIYFKPLVRWTDVMQNDFAARADWCVNSYSNANHQPVVKLGHDCNLNAKSGDVIRLSAKGTTDPDNDELTFKWWYYEDASDYKGKIELLNANQTEASIKIPDAIEDGSMLHIICGVSDNGIPELTRYKRIIIIVKQ